MTRSRGAGRARRIDRALLLGTSTSPWTAILVLTALLALCWGLVWVTGGTQRAFPHIFYAPIILAGLPFGTRGALSAAVVAAVLVGPLMPLDTVTGELQTVQTWITRAVFFLLIGALGATALQARERASQRRLGEDVRAALHRASRGPAVDPSLLPLVADVLRDGTFRTIYQPIYSLTTGRLLAVEALTLFDVEPCRAPDLWFAAAAEVGLGTELEVAALALAIRDSHDLPAGVELSVNASPETLDDPRVADLARQMRTSGRQLTIEITEHAVVEDYVGLLGKVAALRALGVRVAVDDAGAGISSLRHIVELAPDIIKLDISLTQDVAASPLRRALAGSLIEFSERIGAQLVVEGLEEAIDLDTWTHLGAHAGQGYLLARPSVLPVPLVTALVAPHGRFLAGGRSTG